LKNLYIAFSNRIIVENDEGFFLEISAIGANCYWMDVIVAYYLTGKNIFLPKSLVSLLKL